LKAGLKWPRLLSPTPSANDLIGTSANLCVRAKMLELLDHGFEVAVVRDATARAQLPERDGDLAAIISFLDMANALWTTQAAIARINSGSRGAVYQIAMGKTHRNS
jgi:hypothetical protein